MTTVVRPTVPARKDDRIVIHFDYDCFYASVFEAKTPALRSLPLAVQQKHIIVTCNYEARRRGLRKLQLISEAKRICPDLVVVLGEDLGVFRDASKALFCYIKAFTWNGKAERLGFDEVFIDVTDIVAYNQSLLNRNDLSQAFFHLSREDPMAGFSFDATKVAGQVYPSSLASQPLQLISTTDYNDLVIRLVLGSHLAQHIRLGLEVDRGYTSTAGISTSKLLAKLVGNLHKPKDQTILMPPYETVSSMKDANVCLESNITTFIDSHEIGQIPGIGFKMSRKIRDYILSNTFSPSGAATHNEMQESVKISDVRLHPGMGPDILEMLLGGPGAERGIGTKVWLLINGVDESSVRETSMIPSQISIEDSYVCLDTMAQVRQELRNLSASLLRRMYVDLISDADGDGGGADRRWVACPKTIRLSTRPRISDIEDSRVHSLNRTSRSRPIPNFIFNLRESVDALVSRLVQETLLPMFHLLHPAKQNWNLSLINIAVTNMVEMGSEDGNGEGRDIGFMFKQQQAVSRVQRTATKDMHPGTVNNGEMRGHSQTPDEVGFKPADSDECPFSSSVEDISEPAWDPGVDAMWNENKIEIQAPDRCPLCNAIIPPFAMSAHERYHVLGDD